MTDMTPQQRRIALHRLLAGKERVVASELAARWGCVERTIRRDLVKLRDAERLPLEYDPAAQTWHYTRTVAEIPATLVSTADRRALLFSLRAAAGFEGTPVSARIGQLYEDLLATLPPEHATRFARMMKSVHFTGPVAPPIRPQVWDVLLLCLEARQSMQIQYTDGYGGAQTTRTVDPYGLIMRDRHWILVAYCHLREQVLTFALFRIAAAQCTDTPFHTPRNFMQYYLADAFDGLQSTGDPVRVVLRIGKDAPLFIRDRQWSTKEKRHAAPDGTVRVEFQTAALFAVEREIRAADGWVELLEPAESRARLRIGGQAIATAHQ